MSVDHSVKRRVVRTMKTILQPVLALLEAMCLYRGSDDRNFRGRLRKGVAGASLNTKSGLQLSILVRNTSRGTTTICIKVRFCGCRRRAGHQMCRLRKEGRHTALVITYTGCWVSKVVIFQHDWDRVVLPRSHRHPYHLLILWSGNRGHRGSFRLQ